VMLRRADRSKFGEIIAARSMSADTRKQQIPPLRCAPVGMTMISITQTPRH
jgi:hypothetical protein